MYKNNCKTVFNDNATQIMINEIQDSVDKYKRNKKKSTINRVFNASQLENRNNIMLFWKAAYKNKNLEYYNLITHFVYRTNMNIEGIKRQLRKANRDLAHVSRILIGTEKTNQLIRLLTERDDIVYNYLSAVGSNNETQMAYYLNKLRQNNEELPTFFINLNGKNTDLRELFREQENNFMRAIAFAKARNQEAYYKNYSTVWNPLSEKISDKAVSNVFSSTQ